MSCNNCFSGCTEITGDKCVKYTGATIPSLGITNGDTLYAVQQNIVNKILELISGEGIIPVIEASDVCDIVGDFLPEGDLSIVDYVVAAIKAICDVATTSNSTAMSISELNSGYAIDCLTEVSDSSDTHEVVQAIITKLCEVDGSFNTLVNTTLPNTYVLLSDLNSLIQAYIDAQSVGATMKNRMVPYVAMPYFGSLANFDITGAGQGAWSEIYLCNGQNGTPDLRGRAIVGTTTGMGGGAFSPAVDPAISGNPSYSLNTTFGENNVTLSETQIPSHTHENTVSVTDDGHFHKEFTNQEISTFEEINSTNYAVKKLNYTSGTLERLDYQIAGTNTPPTVARTSTETTGISVAITNASKGGGLSHNNVQPVIAAHFIIYIPA